MLKLGENKLREWKVYCYSPETMELFSKLVEERVNDKSYIIDYCEYCKQSGHKDTECPVRLNELMG